ncbi:DUF2889 domain-containing protein [Hydrocarboniphaga sp.]|uniref:DUF2889 domain-containing protein n=1 Tax=Hydrocarboniphaga sp. TaxID=2033016 RepID=UPI002631E32D|nr:DUF2889 domain-containing protein [Hydrocarboniphaga sp.]
MKEGSTGEARAVVEDDYHHFRVVVHYDAGQVISTSTEALRSPYDLCSAAGQRLHELVGMPLSGKMAAAFRVTDARHQCTHQFDIAALAVAAAARGIRQRRYDMVIPDSADGRVSARLQRDGSDVLEWQMDGDIILEPHPYTRRSIGSGFTDWVANQLSEDESEAALVLRRGVFISAGRRMEKSIPSGARPTGGCWVQQPERNRLAVAHPDSRQNFSQMPERLTAADNEWIRFAA